MIWLVVLFLSLVCWVPIVFMCPECLLCPVRLCVSCISCVSWVPIVSIVLISARFLICCLTPDDDPIGCPFPLSLLLSFHCFPFVPFIYMLVFIFLWSFFLSCSFSLSFWCKYFFYFSLFSVSSTRLWYFQLPFKLFTLFFFFLSLSYLLTFPMLSLLSYFLLRFIRCIFRFWANLVSWTAQGKSEKRQHNTRLS